MYEKSFVKYHTYTGSLSLVQEHTEDIIFLVMTFDPLYRVTLIIQF